MVDFRLVAANFETASAPDLEISLHETSSSSSLAAEVCSATHIFATPASPNSLSVIFKTFSFFIFAMPSATESTPSLRMSFADNINVSRSGQCSATTWVTFPVISSPSAVASRFKYSSLECFLKTSRNASPPSSLTLLSVRFNFFNELPCNRAFASISAPSLVNLEPAILKSSIPVAFSKTAATWTVPSSPVMFLSKWYFFSVAGEANNSEIALAACSEMPLFKKEIPSKVDCDCNSLAHARTPFSPKALSDKSTSFSLHTERPSHMISIAFKASTSGLPAIVSAKSTTSKVPFKFSNAFLATLAASIPQLFVDNRTNLNEAFGCNNGASTSSALGPV
mmetsp:Transcript_837/g.2634  ORF Transcript_837/g.2634 Transcript_837/m.2634 type:complete len:338 (-) Transcript_837:420-1433(-)